MPLKSLEVFGLSLEIFYQDSEVNFSAVGEMTRKRPTKELNQIKKPDFTRYWKAIMNEKVNYLY